MLGCLWQRTCLCRSLHWQSVGLLCVCDPIVLVLLTLCSTGDMHLASRWQTQYEGGLHLFYDSVSVCARAALHGDGDGPLHRLVCHLLNAGQRSARLLALAALHLAGLFVQCPPVALLYLPEIQELLVSDVGHAPSQVLHTLGTLCQLAVLALVSFRWLPA